ncbi:MAG: GerMN domain-containing protein [Microbacterium gubbeenense]|uniref:GerMN domain-containing protein n=1 Tax=Microbacterium gubbeenense TaxID=159896 RepID=UPI00040F9BA8|nr:GerMN domain-containing protein [Microbacterium gubbeenense]
MRRTLRTIALGAVLTLALAGCAGLPIEGSFQAGLKADDPTSTIRWQFSPDGPEDGAKPIEIVLGFLDAGESPANDWEVAREFLTPSARTTWDPDARVTVDRVNDREIGDFLADDVGESGQVSVRVAPTASVDETGRYELTGSAVRSLEFELALVDGEWRISSAPDGVVVQSGTFSSIYTPQKLMFSGPGDRLVPDLRWFPDSGGLVDRVVHELVEGGPADWLDLAVSSAFSGVTRNRVTVDDNGSATVDLSAEVEEADPVRRARMQTQLEQTLSTFGVDQVRMMVDGHRVTAPDDAIVSVEPDARALVMTENDFGYLTNGEITPITGLTDAITARFTPESSEDDPARSISVAPDLSHAVVQTEGGEIWRIDAETAEFQALSYETDWEHPALDPFGNAWAVRSDKPKRIVVWDADGEAHEIEGVDGLTQISAIEVARDGARVAIAGRVDNQSVLIVAGIRRDETTSVPVALTGARIVSYLPEAATSAAWVSDTVVAAMMAGEERTLIREQQVGGTAENPTASFVATAITYGNPESRERLLAKDGSLYVRNATTWQQAGSGVVVLATQLGAPPVAGGQ